MELGANSTQLSLNEVHLAHIFSVRYVVDLLHLGTLDSSTTWGGGVNQNQSEGTVVLNSPQQGSSTGAEPRQLSSVTWLNLSWERASGAPVSIALHSVGVNLGVTRKF